MECAYYFFLLSAELGRYHKYARMT
jgi:hypothetical protein